MDDVKWKRVEQLDMLAQELVELHEELQDALTSKSEVSIAQGENVRVEHLGHVVWVQYNEHGLDTYAIEGKTATITREESRSCVRHALDALQNRFRVAVTGQPGIGKTRGSMMYAIQVLLHRKAAVLHVGYKSRKMLLFLPREDGTYRVWSTKSRNFDAARFQDDARVVAVIDPPEDGPYSSGGSCRIVKFVSNNAEKHFRNWEKDGILLVTSMPTEEEVIAMAKVLWDEDKTPHRLQRGKMYTIEEKVREIKKRIELVGTIPRLVFDWRLFVKAIAESLYGADEAAEKVSDSDLYKSLLGKYTPFLGKHPASASGRLFFLCPEPVSHGTWEERSLHRPAMKLTPVATVLLYNRLKERVKALRKGNFEDFAFDWLCMREGRRPEVQRKAKGATDAAYRRIASFRREELRVYRPAAANFAFVDFVSGVTTWYNAKSTSEDATSVYMKKDGAQQFLTRLEIVAKEMFSDDEINMITVQEEVSLTVIANGSAQPKINNSETLRLFGVPVALKAINVTDEVAIQPFKERVNRTRMLLEELDEDF